MQNFCEKKIIIKKIFLIIESSGKQFSMLPNQTISNGEIF